MVQQAMKQKNQVELHKEGPMMEPRFAEGLKLPAKKVAAMLNSLDDYCVAVISEPGFVDGSLLFQVMDNEGEKLYFSTDIPTIDREIEVITVLKEVFAARDKEARNLGRYLQQAKMREALGLEGK
jgi:hypothetical protein